jgi:hypothetical protein
MKPGFGVRHGAVGVERRRAEGPLVTVVMDGALVPDRR